MLRAPWELESVNNMRGIIVELITPEEFDTLEDGTVLVSIFGEIAMKGRDNISTDTRGGMLAFGFIREDQSNRDLKAYEKEI